jgi:hypothetical protein
MPCFQKSKNEQFADLKPLSNRTSVGANRVSRHHVTEKGKFIRAIWPLLRGLVGHFDHFVPNAEDIF